MLQQSERAERIFRLLKKHRHGIRTEQYNWFIWSLLKTQASFQRSITLWLEMEYNRKLHNDGYGWPDDRTYSMMHLAATQLNEDPTREAIERRWTPPQCPPEPLSEASLERLCASMHQTIQQLLQIAVDDLLIALS